MTPKVVTEFENLWIPIGNMLKYFKLWLSDKFITLLRFLFFSSGQYHKMINLLSKTRTMLTQLETRAKVIVPRRRREQEHAEVVPSKGTTAKPKMAGRKVRRKRLVVVEQLLITQHLHLESLRQLRRLKGGEPIGLLWNVYQLCVITVILIYFIGFPSMKTATRQRR